MSAKNARAKRRFAIDRDYDGAGRLVQKDLGNGTRTTYEYDAAGQLLHLINLAPDHATVNSRFDYTYDELGRVATQDNSDGSWVYTYDATGQLTHAVFTSSDTNVLPDQDLQYFYDAVGNRTQTIINGVTTTYTVNNVNEYTQVGDVTYTYDLDGNLHTMTDASGTTTYTFDDLNRLTGVSSPTDTFAYGYDALGQLSSSTVNGVTTSFLNDPTGFGNITGLGTISGEFTSAGSLIAHYAWGLGLTSRTDGSGSAYYDFDMLGSTAGITDATGAYVNRYTYLPFGAAITQATSVANPFTFVAQFGVTDVTPGLYQMGFRSYSVDTGRYLSNDPLRLSGGDPNLIRYAANNPLEFFDPAGLSLLDTLDKAEYDVAPINQRYDYLPADWDRTSDADHLFFPNEKADWFTENADIHHTHHKDDYERARRNAYLTKELRRIRTQLDRNIADAFHKEWGFNPFGPSPSTNPLFRCFVPIFGSGDPNELNGPAGTGTQGWVTPQEALPYTIFFENDPSLANAAAQDVVITQQLDPDLDWSTFALGNIQFGSTIVTVPNGLQAFATSLIVSNIDGTTLRLDIDARLDLDTGIVTWTFHSLDPVTGLWPDNPVAGFLPVNDETHRGEASVQYTVQARTDLVTGALVAAQATIVFDTNAPINTNSVSNPVNAGYPADRLVVSAPAQALPGAPFTVTVSASNANGQVDSQFSGFIALTLYPANLAGALRGTLVAPVVDGVATFTNLSLSALGSYTLYATGTGSLLVGTAPIDVVARPTFKVTVSQTTTIAGDVLSITVTARAANGQPATNYIGPIHFSSTDAQADLPADYTFQASDNGTKTFDIVLKTAGRRTISVADTLLLSLKATSAFINVAPAAASTLNVTGLPPQAMVGFNQFFTVTARDAFGNRATGYRGTVQFSVPAGQATLPADYTFTAKDFGAHTFKVVFTSLSDSQSVIVTDTANNAITGMQSGIFIASPAAKLRITGVPLNIVAGQSFTITVTALTVLNQVDPTYRDTIHFSSSDHNAILPDDYTFLSGDNGVKTFTVTLTTAGTRSIAVSDASRAAVRSVIAATFVRAGATSVLSVTGLPTTAILGVNTRFVVTALDAFGNRATGYRGTIHLAAGPAAATLPADYTFKAADFGAHVFFVRFNALADDQNITATDTAVNAITGTQAGITVVSNATRLRITGVPVGAMAGQQFTIAVAALNALGQIDTAFVDTIHFTSTDLQADLPADYTFVPGDNGVKTFNVTLKTAGIQRIFVENLTRPVIKKAGGQTAVSHAAVSMLSVSGFPAQDVAGAMHKITVTAVDAFGNRVSNYRGRVHFTSTDPGATLPGAYTFSAFDQGRHVFPSTLITAGAQSITVADIADGAITGTQADINVAAFSAGVAGPTVGVRGQFLDFVLTANQAGMPADTVYTFRIDWDGNGRFDQVVSGPSGMVIRHAYPATANLSVKMTALDAFGHAAVAAPQAVAIQAVALLTDPVDVGKTALFVGGGAGSNKIVITPTDALGEEVSVSINGVVQPGGPFAPTGHIVVYGQNGNDTIQLVAAGAVQVAIPAVLFGGGGADVLSAAGSSANNVAVGGTGADNLTGGAGRDILIGGDGADQLHASADGSILIGGSSTHDADLSALLAIATEWTSARQYQARVQSLFGDRASGANGTALLDPASILQDTTTDFLYGGAGLDWFWASAARLRADKLLDMTNDEIASVEN